MEVLVSIRVSDVGLRNALESRLRESPGLRLAANGGELARGSVIVSVVRDCPPPDCARLASEGRRVIILVPVHRAQEAEQYRVAGAAAYLPMDLDVERLAGAIRDADSVRNDTIRSASR